MLDGANGVAVSALLDAAHARKLSFAPLGSNPFGFPDSQAELTDVLLRARAYDDQLTKWFTEPMWFDGGPGGVQILITQDEDNYMYAWVGSNGAGLLVTFDTVNLLGYGLDEPGVRAGIAIAIGWFLDISVSLRKTPGGTGTIRRTSTGTTPATGWSYVPTPIFASQQAGVSVGAAPRLHGVLAHLRTLAAGHTPSRDAQSRAPSRLRAGMKQNQTFVRPHFRGQAYRGILDARLSKYSALADVLAGLERLP